MFFYDFLLAFFHLHVFRLQGNNSKDQQNVAKNDSILTRSAQLICCPVHPLSEKSKSLTFSSFFASCSNVPKQQEKGPVRFAYSSQSVCKQAYGQRNQERPSQSSFSHQQIAQQHHDIPKKGLTITPIGPKTPPKAFHRVSQENVRVLSITVSLLPQSRRNTVESIYHFSSKCNNLHMQATKKRRIAGRYIQNRNVLMIGEASNSIISFSKFLNGLNLYFKKEQTPLFTNFAHTPSLFTFPWTFPLPLSPSCRPCPFPVIPSQTSILVAPPQKQENCRPWDQKHANAIYFQYSFFCVTLFNFF